ncbi:MAG: DUF4330 family protein [Ruminococcaceae bacterium]|nr:DUF4330 family protein [Oscillospiraceae bacterium]
MNENNATVTKTQKSEKKKGKFNFIDFLLILILVMLIASIVYVLMPSNWIKGMFADKSVNIEYSIEIIGVDKAYIENIKDNDVVLDGVSKANIGTVKAVTDITQYTELKYNEETNQGVLSPVEGKYNIIVTITATADYNEGQGYTVNGTRIAVGEKINARFPNYVCDGYCISVPR